MGYAAKSSTSPFVLETYPCMHTIVSLSTWQYSLSTSNGDLSRALASATAQFRFWGSGEWYLSGLDLVQPWMLQSVTELSQ